MVQKDQHAKGDLYGIHQKIRTSYFVVSSEIITKRSIHVNMTEIINWPLILVVALLNDYSFLVDTLVEAKTEAPVSCIKRFGFGFCILITMCCRLLTFYNMVLLIVEANTN